MKEKILERLNRIENVIRQSQNVGMVASKRGDVISWNGIDYANEEDFHRATELILGEDRDMPLIILNDHRRENV